jgi:hypothetical protein
MGCCGDAEDAQRGKGRGGVTESLLRLGPEVTTEKSYEDGERIGVQSGFDIYSWRAGIALGPAGKLDCKSIIGVGRRRQGFGVPHTCIHVHMITVLCCTSNVLICVWNHREDVCQFDPLSVPSSGVPK